jgi:deazaflavin-dependent oxidoreductase (nitroreductase family)
MGEPKRLPWITRTWFRLVGLAGVNPVSARLHPVLYRWTGGRGPLGRQLGNRAVTLITTGAHSGRPRTVPLWAFPDGDAWVVVASRGGHPQPPAWYRNLVANPAARLVVGRTTLRVMAREADGTEYDRLWAKVNAAYPGYAFYRDRAGRHIPLVVLEALPEMIRP